LNISPANWPNSCTRIIKKEISMKRKEGGERKEEGGGRREEEKKMRRFGEGIFAGFCALQWMGPISK
jgi:hypothetical protein